MWGRAIFKEKFQYPISKIMSKVKSQKKENANIQREITIFNIQYSISKIIQNKKLSQK